METSLFLGMPKHSMDLWHSVAELIAPELSLQGLGRHRVSQELPQLGMGESVGDADTQGPNCTAGS